MIPNQEIRDKVRYEFDSRWMFGPTGFAFTAMEAGYNNCDEWMDAVCAYLRGNVALVNTFVAEKMPKVKVTRHEGTFLMWLDMTCAGMGSSEITSILAKEYGLALGDGSHYGKQSDGFNEAVVAMAALVLCTIINMIGLKSSALVQKLMVALLMISLLLFIAFGLPKVDWSTLSLAVVFSATILGIMPSMQKQLMVDGLPILSLMFFTNLIITLDGAHKEKARAA